MKIKSGQLIYIVVCIFLYVSNMSAQIVLLGDNSPHPNVNDGNFKAVRGNWRQLKQSPFWKTFNIEGLGEYKMGIHNGSMFNINDLGMAESVLLNTNPDYQNPKAGDVMKWGFGADLEYISDGTISLSLVFGEHERVVADKVKLIGSDKIVEHFEGTYTLTEENAKRGLPFVRATFYTEDEIKVFLHYVNISVVDDTISGPQLSAEVVDDGIQLTWSDNLADDNSVFNIYRQFSDKETYEKLDTTTEFTFTDKDLINGVDYTYLVTRFHEKESGASNKVKIARYDNVPPAPPTKLKADIHDSEIIISWTRSVDDDVKNYTLFRGDENGNNLQKIAAEINKTSFLDFTPTKDIENTYMVVAEDYCGNKSQASEILRAKPKMIKRCII